MRAGSGMVDAGWNRAVAGEWEAARSGAISALKMPVMAQAVCRAHSSMAGMSSVSFPPRPAALLFGAQAQSIWKPGVLPEFQRLNL
jgi:hypothetical protein